MPQLEYVAPTSEEFEVLLALLKDRIDRGQGETIYEIGIGGTATFITV